MNGKADSILHETLQHGAVADAPSLQTDLASFSKFISQLDSADKLNVALYQLAYEREPGLALDNWTISSIKAVSVSISSATSANLPIFSVNPAVPFARRILRLYLSSSGWPRGTSCHKLLRVPCFA